MKFDDYSLLYSEYDIQVGNGMKAAVGDSCANSGRLKFLEAFNLEIGQGMSFREYFDNTRRAIQVPTVGYHFIRHPLIEWESFGPDQWLPRFWFAKYCGHINECKEMWAQLPLHPMCWATVPYLQWSLPILLFIQELLFKLPWRWSDTKHTFESSAGQVQDYPNWFIVAAAIGYKPKLTSKKTFLAAIQLYSKNELSVGGWCFLDLWQKAADKVWGLELRFAKNFS